MTTHFKQISRHLINELGTTREKVSIAVAWFTNDMIFDHLLTLLEKKIKIELIVVNDKINNRDTGLDFNLFIKQGGTFYFADSSSLMHHKFVIIDDQKLISGSYNWTYNAEYRNSENVIVSSDQVLIENFKREFLQIKIQSIHQKDKVTVAPKVNADIDVDLFIKSFLINVSRTQERKGKLNESLDTLEIAKQLDNSDTEITERINEIKNKMENPLYHYHIEDGQFSFDFYDKRLIGKEGEIVRPYTDRVADEDEIYILSIDGFYVECIGNIEREFPRTKEDHERLKDFLLRMNNGE